MKRAAYVLLAFMCASVQAASAAVLTLDVGSLGAFSCDGQGEPCNLTLTVDVGAALGAPGADVNFDGLGWDLTIETVGGSLLTEAVISFQNPPGTELFTLTAGALDNFPGTMFYSSGGILDLNPVLGFTPVIGGGLLTLEFFESTDDVSGVVDANYLNPSFLTFDIVLPKVRLQHTDMVGAGTAFLGTDIEIDLILDIPPPPVTDLSFTVTWDDGLVSLDSITELVPLCPAPGSCLTFVSQTPTSAEILFEDASGFEGFLPLAGFSFTGDQTGDAVFGISPGGTNPPGIDFGGTTVEIVDIQPGTSGSLPQTFEAFDPETGFFPNWSTFGPGPQWDSTVECAFGNVTGGDGEAACLQPTAPAKGASGLGDSFLCTDAPLDTSTADQPVLGLLANFQPTSAGSATFRIIGGDTAPPNVGGYGLPLFERDQAIGTPAAGENLTIALPLEDTLYFCVVVEGDYVYAQVDECASCAVSFDIVDSDGDGISDNVDNCINVPNPDQRDTDDDNIGNICDADIAPAPNDCIVNGADLQALRMAFFAQVGDAAYSPDADFNGDGIINFADLSIMKQQYFGLPGPSGLPNDCEMPKQGVRLRACGIPD